MVGIVAPDFVEIVMLSGDAHAFLRIHGPSVGALIGAEKNVLELDHPGVGEEERWVVARDEGRRSDDGVAVLDKKVDEFPADLRAGAELRLAGLGRLAAVGFSFWHPSSNRVNGLYARGEAEGNPRHSAHMFSAAWV